MIGWKHAHHGIRIDRLKNLRRQSDRRSCVALGWFGQNLALGNLGKLPHDFRAQMIVSENPDALRRDHRTQTIHRLLDQGAVAEKFQDLFRVARRLRGQNRVPRPPARISP